MRHLKLYNTESRKKEEIIPLDGKTIRMYTCGPTVYNFAHIGNFRTYVFEDLLRRTIKFFGYNVEQVMNITDVEDKTLKGALEKRISLEEFTKPFKEAFFEDLKTLNIERVEHYPEATHYIPEMIRIIEGLLQSEIAYKGHDGSIYFSIRAFPSYGRLSHLPMQSLKAGASGVTVDEYDKENVSDFVLWKIYDPERDGSIYWESPFGKGRPGWHIECSAMAMKLLGATLDIHVGGVDNMFPHHENEIAQSEGYSGCCFVKHWLHVEHLLVEQRKMSKSLGNFYTLRDLLDKGYTGAQVRYLLLQTHYRTPLNFTFTSLDGAAAALERLSDFLQRIKQLQETGREDSQGSIATLLKERMDQFRAHLGDDINISAALSSIFDCIREINQLSDQQKLDRRDAKDVLDFLHKIDQVLGVMSFEEESIPDELIAALKAREEARAQKEWKLSDHYRDQIASSGYLIEDTPLGPRLKKRSL